MGPRGWIRIAVLVFGALVAWWAVTPFDDHVPLVPPDEAEEEEQAVGEDEEDEEDEAPPAAVRFDCAAIADDADPTPSAAAREHESLLSRRPCESARQQRGLVAALDLALVLVVLPATFARGGRLGRPG